MPKAAILLMRRDVKPFKWLPFRDIERNPGKEYTSQLDAYLEIKEYEF